MQLKHCMTILLCLTFTLIGCTADEAEQQGNQENMNSQPINYETPKEQDERTGNKKESIGERGGYPQSEQNQLNNGDDNAKTDLYTNDTSIKISEHLRERKDVRQAQVAVTEERIVVGIMVSEHAPPDMRKLIEQKVQEMVPDKEVSVYTDDIYWDRMRNRDARLDQLNGNTEEFLDEFFNRDRDDFK